MSCSEMFAIAYSYKRVMYRLGILRLSAECCKDAMTSAIEYCSRIEKSSVDGNVEGTLKKECESHEKGKVTCAVMCYKDGGGVGKLIWDLENGRIVADDGGEGVEEGTHSEGRQCKVLKGSGGVKNTMYNIKRGTGGAVKKIENKGLKGVSKISKKTVEIKEKLEKKFGNKTKLLVKNKIEDSIKRGGEFRILPGPRVEKTYKQVIKGVPPLPAKGGKIKIAEDEVMILRLIQSLKIMGSKNKSKGLNKNEKEILQGVTESVGGVVSGMKDISDTLDMIGG